MRTLAEEAPARGVALEVRPGIRRVVARNAGPLTYHGTNTYLLDWPGGIAVLDPGPEDERHVDDVLRAAGAPVAAILLTHGHPDHWGSLPALRSRTGAPVHAWHAPAVPDVVPDVPLRDGDRVGPWEVLHTPGHAPDHVCLLGPDGVLISGDHVMGWSTTVVGGAGGDMTAYFRSLERLLGLSATVYLPGHGPAIDDPTPYAAALLKHRRMREAAILRVLGEGDAADTALVERLYPQLDASLRAAARRSVLAHLGKLQDEGRVAQDGGRWRLQPA